MPAPATTEQLLKNLRKSGLVPPAQLDRIPVIAEPAAVLEQLVDSQLLTRYQAEKIASGKYRGFVLGPYVILDRLGGGGMGHVFLAEHSAMRRNVALKVLSVGACNDAVAVERFQREGRVAAGLDHPNIVRVFDLRVEDKISYLVMEYVDGDCLQHIVSRHGPLPWQTAAHYTWQIALGLQYAHQNGLVHRDIKPANLLLGRDGYVRIIDLGLVRWEEEADSQLTAKMDKSILGTADYLAPEQAVNSATVDIRADIYSLGATLYFLLAGRTIFPEGKTAQKLMWQQLKTPTPIRDLAPNVPPELAEILHKCLSKSPSDRFNNPSELAAALEKWCEGPPPMPELKWFPPQRRKGAKSGVSSSIGPSPMDTMTPPPRRVGTDSRNMMHSGRYAQPKMPSESPSKTFEQTVPDSGTETPRRWPSEQTPLTLPPLERTSGEFNLPAPPRSASRHFATVLAAAVALLLLGAGAFLAYAFTK
ncbi:hypothetical protein BH11PLA2_BH11PLA2_04610 [soil metagenome]